MIYIRIFCAQFELTKLTCEEGFVLYKQTFNKSYQQDEKMHFDIFCSNFRDVVELLKTDPNLPIGLVPMMDSHVNKYPRKSNMNKYYKTKPQNDICSTINPLPDLMTVYSSVDLREMDLITPSKSQGTYLWSQVFSTNAIFENSILRDKKNLNSFWQTKASPSILNLSEQYLMSNLLCDSCNYDGIIFRTFNDALYNTVPGNLFQRDPPRKPISTVDLMENYPFDYNKYLANWTSNIALPTKLLPENILLPLKFFNNSGVQYMVNWCNLYAAKTPIVKIFDDDKQNFNISTIKTIQSYLSRGLAIAMNIFIGSGPQQILFQNFKGNAILHNECEQIFSSGDHAVTLVGYGKKSGKDVWVIKNSWGEWWGDKGFFFFEIGKNSYCSEQFAYTSIPKYFDMTETTPYSRGTLKRGLTYTLDCDNYFTNISGKVDCYDTCPPAYPVLLETNQCVNISCPSDKMYVEHNQCSSKCTTNAYYVSGSINICVPFCSGFFIQITSSSKQCIEKCPESSPYYQPGTCVSKCSSGIYSAVNQKLVCQDVCNSVFVLNASNDNSQQCLQFCPSDAPYSDAGLCSLRCISGAYSIIDNQYICQDSCSLFITNISNQNSKQCIKFCPLAAPYYDPGSCSVSCTSGYFTVDSGVQQFFCQQPCALFINMNNQRQCVKQCPLEAPFNDSGLCSVLCSSNTFLVINSIQTCVSNCSKYFVQQQNQQLCVSSCTTPLTYINGTECVHSCEYFKQTGSENICVNPCQIFQIQDGLKKCLEKCNGDVVDGECHMKEKNTMKFVIIAVPAAVGGIIVLIILIVTVKCCQKRTLLRKSNAKAQLKENMKQKLISTDKSQL
ncbi:Cathepsin_L [Hexamita inflata]|uniref:Cathepsin L n=1 Tax=Hexamita inflata TaxID=28002 RepID=A0AA86PE29_9EUKA|nr:Cathepsin L [Hexamita inflata]